MANGYRPWETGHSIISTAGTYILVLVVALSIAYCAFIAASDTQESAHGRYAEQYQTTQQR